MKLKIGTRGSKLALWQANHVKDLLEGMGIGAELTIIKTTGDLNQVQALNKIGGKGLFTKELDLALLRKEVDLAVHSTKDIPTILEDELEFSATLKREDPRDVLLAESEEVDLDNFNRKMVIGTSSLRRQAFLKRFAAQCEVKVIRGNVDTRVRKMRDGEYDGIVLAYAGVKRMGFTDLIVRKLNVNTFTPAVGQGAIGIMSARERKDLSSVIEKLNHYPTYKAVLSERAYLRKMEGGCHTPIFGLATIIGETLSLQGGVASEDGQTLISEQVEGNAANAEALGLQLADLVINRGGGKLIS